MTDLASTRISFLRLLAYLGSSMGLILLCGGAVAGAKRWVLGLPPSVEGEPFTIAVWLTYVALAAAVTLAFRLQVRLVERRPCREFAADGIGRLALGAVAGIGLVALLVAIMWLGGAYHVAAVRGPGGLAAPTLMALGAALLEEVLMRGFLLGLVARWRGPVTGLIVSALVFGGLHYDNDGAGAWPLVALTLGAGLALGGARLATGRLWLPIGLHFGWNFGQSALFGLLDSGSSFESLVDARIAGPYWLTGGAFGPEASLPGFAIWVGAAVLMLRVALSRAKPASVLYDRT